MYGGDDGLQQEVDFIAVNVAMLESPMMGRAGIEARLRAASATGESALDTARRWVKSTIVYYQSEFATMAYAGFREGAPSGGWSVNMRIEPVGDSISKRNNLTALQSVGVPRPQFDPVNERERWARDVKALRDVHLGMTISRKWKTKVAMMDAVDQSGTGPLVRDIDLPRMESAQAQLPRGFPAQQAVGQSRVEQKAATKRAAAARARAAAIWAVEVEEAAFAEAQAAWEKRAEQRYRLVQTVKKLPRPLTMMDPPPRSDRSLTRTYPQGGTYDNYAWLPVQPRATPSGGGKGKGKGMSGKGGKGGKGSGGKGAGAPAAPAAAAAPVAAAASKLMIRDPGGLDKNIPKAQNWYEEDAACAARLQERLRLLRLQAAPAAQEGAVRVEGEVFSPALAADGAAAAAAAPVAAPVAAAVDPLTPDEQEWLDLYDAELAAKNLGGGDWLLLGVSNGRRETLEEAQARLKTKNAASPASVSDLERRWLSTVVARLAARDGAAAIAEAIQASAARAAQANAASLALNEALSAQRGGAFESDGPLASGASGIGDTSMDAAAPGTVALVAGLEPAAERAAAAATGYQGPSVELLLAARERAPCALDKPKGAAKPLPGEPLCVTLERLDEALQALEAARAGARAQLDAAARREWELDELLREIFGALLDQPPADEQAALAALNAALGTPPPPPSAALVRAMGGGEAWRLPYARYLMGFVALAADGERVARFVALPLSPLQWARAPGSGGGASLRDADHFAALRRATMATAATAERLAPDALAATYRPRSDGGGGAAAAAPPMVHVAAAAARLLEQAEAAPSWRAALVFG